MKRILLSIALPLCIVAVAWQFAPAEVEVAIEPPVGAAAVEEIEGELVFTEALDGNDAALTVTTSAVRPNGKVNYKRLLAQNPDLVQILIDSSGEVGDGEYAELIQFALISIDGAAVPHLLKIPNETEDSNKKQVVAGLLATAAIFPNYPIEEVVPSLLKLAKSDDEEEKEIGVVSLAQILHFQGLSEVQRIALRLEILTTGF